MENLLYMDTPFYLLLQTNCHNFTIEPKNFVASVGNMKITYPLIRSLLGGHAFNYN